MTNDEQILAGIEELANQIKDLKKSIKGKEPEYEGKQDWGSKLEQIEILVKKSQTELSEQNHIIKEIKNYNHTITLNSLNKSNEVVHNYIEVKNATRWLWSIVSGGFVCFTVIFILVSILIKRNEQLTTSKANDLKYRFMKVQSESLLELKKVAANSTELAYYFDALYKDNPIKFENYVTNREEQIHIAFEAAEIAKNKEIEARKAFEKAQQLKNDLEY